MKKLLCLNMLLLPQIVVAGQAQIVTIYSKDQIEDNLKMYGLGGSQGLLTLAKESANQTVNRQQAQVSISSALDNYFKKQINIPTNPMAANENYMKVMKNHSHYLAQRAFFAN